MVYTAEDHAFACRRLLEPAVERVGAREPDLIAIRDAELSGRVAATALFSDIPLPPFDNSQMDGYAVFSEDLVAASAESPVELRVGVATAAGDPPVQHERGTVSPIMTGAPIPEGADAVVPVELGIPPKFPPLYRAGEAPIEARMRFTAPATPDQFVRRTGSDLPSGVEIVAAGTRITPTRVGALAAGGLAEVPVRSRPRVLICSTGDEIVQAGSTEPLGPGLIRDANAPMLAAAIRSTGAEARVLRSGDRPEAFRAALEAEWEWPDIIATIGGISAGAFEVVKETLEPLGASFPKVAMQPGGPQGLGVITLNGPGGERAVPILCFPGNPVSTVLSAELFLLPTLRELAGLPGARRREERLLAHDSESPKGKLQLRRGRIEPDGRVRLSGPSSHLLSELAGAEVIAEIPLGVAEMRENSPVEVWRIND